jgi:hypothetical protein
MNSDKLAQLNEIKIYRMTHIDNIEHILKYGITHQNSPKANPNYVHIGDMDLINNRNTFRVFVTNGNDSISNAQQIVLGDFIPFYFGVRMPMLYVVGRGGNFVKRAYLMQEIIYLTCHISDIVQSKSAFFFSDGHATDSFSLFYDKTKIDKLSQIINWDAIKTKYWGGNENLDIKRKKQAEFLVLGDIGVNCLNSFGCYNEQAKEKLIKIGVKKEKIMIVANAYF